VEVKKEETEVKPIPKPLPQKLPPTTFLRKNSFSSDDEKPVAKPIP